jgi:hypothetical protein
MVMTRRLSLLFALLFPVASLLAQTGSPSATPPPSTSASHAPALPEDRHGGLSISVDPYTNTERAKAKFGKANPVPAGILPVEVFLKSEIAHPIKVNLETVQLDVRIENQHQDLDWLSAAQVANLIVHPRGNPSAPSERRFPVGIPTPSKDKKVDRLAQQLRPFALDSDIVPPLGTIHGFLFFDVNRDFEAATTSSLYIPDVVLLPEKTPLMFFEVPLTSAASSPPPSPQP